MAGSDFHDDWIIKIDKNGKEQWNVTIEAIRNKIVEKAQSWITSLIQTKDGGYMLSGAIPTKVGDNNAWIIKTNRFGRIQRNMIFGGNNEDLANSVIQISDNSYIFVGTTNVSSDNDAWLVHFNGRKFIETLNNYNKYKTT